MPSCRQQPWHPDLPSSIPCRLVCCDRFAGNSLLTSIMTRQIWKQIIAIPYIVFWRDWALAERTLTQRLQWAPNCDSLSLWLRVGWSSWFKRENCRLAAAWPGVWGISDGVAPARTGYKVHSVWTVEGLDNEFTVCGIDCRLGNAAGAAVKKLKMTILQSTLRDHRPCNLGKPTYEWGPIFRYFHAVFTISRSDLILENRIFEIP
jgi:hypothetical protein